MKHFLYAFLTSITILNATLCMNSKQNINQKNDQTKVVAVNGYKVKSKEITEPLDMFDKIKICTEKIIYLSYTENKKSYWKVKERVANSLYTIYDENNTDLNISLKSDTIIKELVQNVNIKTELLEKITKNISTVIVIETFKVGPEFRNNKTGTKFFLHNACSFKDIYPKSIIVGLALPYGDKRTTLEQLNEFYAKCGCTMLTNNDKAFKNTRGIPFYIILDNQLYTSPAINFSKFRLHEKSCQDIKFIYGKK